MQDSIGTLGAVLTVVGACLLVIAILVLMTLAVLRLTRLVAAHHTATLAYGQRARGRLDRPRDVRRPAGRRRGGRVPGRRLARRQPVPLDHARACTTRPTSRPQAKVDPFQNTPGNQLLNGLRGKDVLLTFVESYGRYAVEDPKFAPPVDAQLDAATKRLDALGFGSRSAYLSSSTVGGASWLAHSTLLSGLYIDSQQRYRSLVASNRLTLTSAFKKAGWKTVSVEPAITGAWPEGKFFGYEQDYDARNLGYKGSRFSYATMPDQYLYSVFHRNELGPGHAPVFAEITTVSSHSPWTPIPKMVGWDQVGDGSIFDNPANQEGGPPGSILGSADKLRASYIRSIQYSLDALVSYVENYGDKNLVLVFLGDHQPAPIVTGAGREPGRADHDRGQGPEGAGPDLVLELDARPAPGPERTGDQDGHLPQPVHDHLRPGGSSPLAVVTEGQQEAGDRRHQRDQVDRDPDPGRHAHRGHHGRHDHGPDHERTAIHRRPLRMLPTRHTPSVPRSGGSGWVEDVGGCGGR